MVVYVAHGAVLAIQIAQQTMMNIVQGLGIAAYGMEMYAATGAALLFHKPLQHIMTSTAQNGTAICGMSQKKSA